jgi:hypothetical protein
MEACSGRGWRRAGPNRFLPSGERGMAFRAQSYLPAGRQASSIRGEVRLASTTGAAGARRTALPSGGEGLPVVGLGLDRVDEQAARPAVAFRHPAPGAVRLLAGDGVRGADVEHRAAAADGLGGALPGRPGPGALAVGGEEQPGSGRAGAYQPPGPELGAGVRPARGDRCGPVRSFLGQALAAAAGTLVPGGAPGPHPLGELPAALHRPIGCGVPDGRRTSRQLP